MEDGAHVERRAPGVYLVDGDVHLHPEELLEAAGERVTRRKVYHLVVAYRKAAQEAGRRLVVVRNSEE